MKSRKKILAGMVAMALGSGAYAATFEGRLACDQDPREAATSCMLFVPVTDTVGLPVYTQQISVTYLLEPRGAAAAGMESEAQASSDISAGASVTESFEVAEAKPILSEGDRQVSAASSRGRLFGWLRAERGSSSADSRSRDLASTSLMESDHLAGTEPGSAHQSVASASGRGIFSWLTGERRSRPMSEQSAAIESQPSSDQFVISERSSGKLAPAQPRDLASTSLMESDHLAGTEPSAEQGSS